MNARPAKVCDWADERATELLAALQLMPGNTVADICNTLAVALRNERAKGYAQALNLRVELREYAIGLGQRTRAPRDVRQQLYDLRRTIRDFDTQSDHDVERTEGWAAGEGAL